MEKLGAGPVLASAIVVAVPDPKAFKSGRNLAPRIGLVPRQNFSGGKERLGSIPVQPKTFQPCTFRSGGTNMDPISDQRSRRRPPAGHSRGR